MKTFVHYTNHASTKDHCKSIDITMILRRVILILFIAVALINSPHYIFAQVNTENNYDNNNDDAIITDPNKEVPSVVVTLEEKEVEMDPFMYFETTPANTIEASQLNETQNKIVTKIGNPNLFGTQSDIDTKLQLNQGDKITLSYGKQPIETKAYLIDYDTENETEIYPIKQIDYSTFSIPTGAPEGLTNLEIRCFFANNEEITYVTSVFVEPNNPVVNTQDGSEQNNEENNGNENE